MQQIRENETVVGEEEDEEDNENEIKVKPTQQES